jgi:uncharacterized protein HemX
MPKVTRPGRASRAASEQTTTTKPAAAKAGNGEESAAPTREETEPTAAGAKDAGATTAAGAQGAEPSLQERMEGLQRWMADIERKQGRTAYFGAVAVLIAIAAAGAALYYGITAKNDSATKGDVDALEERLDALQSAVTKNSKDTQDTINNSIAQLQGSIQALQKQQAQDAANISTLQSQAASGALGKKAAAGTSTTVTPGATTTTTTTTPKKP